uniref:RNase H type-1 domain-containing protein n=1 Tax=Aegilops tauschii subsp. strangulata TaxID=200361 RepID=A0A453J4P8_AEGTS
DLVQPKSKGGAGFRDFRIFNQALLARQAWRLIYKPDSLCAQVLKARYYPNGNIQDTVFSGNASSSSQAISYGLDLLKKGLIWRVGNGRSIRVWRDNWIPRPFSYKPITLQGRCRIRFVSDLLNNNGSWNAAVLQEFFLPADVVEILKIRASPRQEDDTLAWGPGKYGVFSVRSAYEFGFEEAHRSSATGSSAHPDGRRSCWKLIWSSDVLPTVKNFAWRVATNSLPTWRNKNRRGLEVHALCPVCASEPEDCHHALCRCTLSRGLWDTMSEVWPLPCLATVLNNGDEWLLHMLEPLQEVERSMVLMTFWRAWHIRNEIVHHKPPPPMEASKRFLVSYMDSLIGIKTDLSSDPNRGKSYITYEPRMPHAILNIAERKWSAPKLGWVKLEIDGSFMDDGSAGAGMVLRDDKGAIIFSSCRQLFSCRDALEAELCACMEGLSFALQRSELPVQMEMDSIVAVKLIQASGMDRSVYTSVIKEIKYLMSLRETCITHVNCS